MEACLYCLFGEQSDCPVTMETSLRQFFFSNFAACVIASCITICFILFVVTSSQSYKNDVFAILTENRHFVTMATGKPLKPLINSVTSITTPCCHTLVEVIRFFVALSLHFHKKQVLAAIFMKKMVAWLPWKHMNCTHIPANFAACVVGSNIIANCELPILFL